MVCRVGIYRAHIFLDRDEKVTQKYPTDGVGNVQIWWRYANEMVIKICTDLPRIIHDLQQST